MQETTARVQFDKKYLIALVLPLVIEQVLAVTVGMADMIMVSGAGDTAVSGVSLVNTISNLLIYIFNALATGGAVVAAQALGAKKKKTGQIVANQLVLICLIVSVVISAVCIVFDRAILTLIYGKVEQAVMDQAVTYFFITGFSFPFIAVYDGASSLLRSMGKASISLFVSAIMNGLNILFNAIFVFGYNMGIAGVGYGTLISRVVAGIVVVFILRNEKYDLHIDKYFRFGVTIPMWMVSSCLSGVSGVSGVVLLPQATSKSTMARASRILRNLFIRNLQFHFSLNGSVRQALECVAGKKHLEA